MDANTIKEIVANIRVPKVIKVNEKDVLVLPQDWKDETPAPPETEPLILHTLDSLITFIEKMEQDPNVEASYVHILNPNTVDLLGYLEGESTLYRRNAYATAKCDPWTLPGTTYHESEWFIIALQTQFVQTQERDNLIALLSSIRESSVRETTDDGFTQEVKTARGVHISDRTKVPKTVTLKPYRTFREIEQPESTFVLRLREGTGTSTKPQVAIFEADGGAWKLDAIKSIANFLNTKVTLPVLA